MSRAAALTGAVLSAALIAGPAGGIVVRHDAPPTAYRAQAGIMPALVDLPESGHGVLIAPLWVVTVAHAVDGRQGSLRSVMIGGEERAVAQVIVHPNYAAPPGPGPDGSIKPIMDASREMRDIALIRLAQPVTDIAPATLHWGDVGIAETVTILGKGRGGTGVNGAARYLPQRGELRQARNRVLGVEERWISYRFDQGDNALPDEGSIGAGDSGGPVLVERAGAWHVAALASWTFWDGALQDYAAGRYGLVTNHTRLAAYRDWIAEVTGIAF